jgi:erythromycin esterase-like protein
MGSARNELARATRAVGDFDAVLARVADAPIVLLGEATHGTHEFYEARTRITQRLIEEKNFGAVIVEADWPDAYRVNRYVMGHSDDRGARQALGDFERFPRWMWRNTDVVQLVRWMRAHNAERGEDERVGFYGMDLYSMFRSIALVIEFLDRVDPEAAERARERYRCFGHYGGEARAYGYGAGIGLTPGCETQAVAQLMDLRALSEEHVRAGGYAAEDEQFFAEQNARLVGNAEHYYRGMFSARVNTWNLRDRHMVETIEALRDHLRDHGRSDRVVVWAHNSHLGDARATDVGDRGQLNVGQLLRERHRDQVVIVGFTTYEGTVTAASKWDGPAEKKRVRQALAGSWERVLHELPSPPFTLVTRDVMAPLTGWKLNRAIGVIYLPETERMSHYFFTDLARQFDVVIHYDSSNAVEPLERWPIVTADVDETYPFGL